MKTIIFILIILSFIQTTILPINLVLIVLLSRALVRPDKSNLYLAFGFGLFLSLISLEPLGFKSLTFLILVQLTENLSRSRFSANQFLIIPIVIVFSTLDLAATAIFSQQSIIIWPQVVIEGVLSLPIFFIVRIWEERFIIKKGIKLRV